MWLEFMTPDVWNGLVLAVVIIGLALAGLRLYRDLSPPSDTADKAPPRGVKKSGRSKRRR